MAIDQDTLIKLRGVMLEILDEFVRICEENNLTYFLSDGTLLGAVRHKGFIPWDDDIDVAMPRKDYEKFLDIVSSDTKSNYYALSHRCPVNTYYHYRAFTRFCKKGTIFAQENKKSPEEYSGIFIDIWPFDNCILSLTRLHKKFTLFAWRIYRLKTQKEIPSKKYKLFLIKIINRLLPLKLFEIILKISYTIFNNFRTKNIVFFYGFTDITKNCQKYDTIFPLAKIVFEGKQYFAPGDYNTYLTRVYGNYMELPPVEQRLTHGIKFISFDDTERTIEKFYQLHE
ncbi:MAG: LicD family protein [Treponema sp.]|jgi:lipopolysaccharide cholinephosphotransferase|nr:LicD family protein [Treponema sp.]